MTTYLWKGSGPNHTGLWETATDWNPTGVPGAADIAIVDIGVVTEDVNQSQILPNNTINPGVEISALHIGVGGALDIGDAAGTNFAIVTLAGSVASSVLGSIVINVGGASGSELRASGTIQTSSSGVSQTGTIDIVGGKLLALGSLTITGGGTIAMDGGYIGGSSANPSDNFINHATISGIGDISAANYYAAPPAIPLSGPLNYHGLVTYNYGTIDATNLAAGANYLTISGGVTYNFGMMEATNSISGSSGYAALGSNEGAIIVNEVGGTIAAMTGAYVTLGGPVTNKGELLADGGYLTFTGAVVSTGQEIVENGGFLTFDASTTIAGTLTVDGTSGLTATGTITTSYGTATGTITIDSGIFTAVGPLRLTGAGVIDLNEGEIIDSSSVATNTLVNYLTIAGTGYISAYTTFMGANNYHGLVTYNYGTIDATNLAAGANYLTISGGVTYNFGMMEATNSISGSSGYAVLGSNEGATIVNEVGGTIAAMTGAYVTLGGPVTNKGELLADGGYLTFTGAVVSTGQAIVENGGFLTFGASATVAGTLTIDATSGLTASGTITTSYGTATGTIDIGEGSLFALGTLSIAGNGAIALDGGQIGDSSNDPVDTLINRVTISGVGYINAYNVYSGTGAYNGLNTYNYGTIDATNINSGLNVLAISGGVVHNYGTLEANNSVSGSSGTADLFIDFGAVIINSSTGFMVGGSGAGIALSGGTIDNGELLGTLSVYGTGNVIESTGSTPSGFVNDGTIYVYGALTINALSSSLDNQNARIEVDVGGALTLTGNIDSSSGTIAVDGGKFTAASNSLISDSLGQLVIGENGSGGSATIDSQLLLGDGLTSIDSGSLTLHAGAASSFYDNGVLAIGSGGDVSGYITFGSNGAIDLDTQLFNSGLTGTYYQASGTSGLLTVASHTFDIMGDYQTVGSTTTFGAGGGTSGFAIQADVNNHNVAQIYR